MQVKKEYLINQPIEPHCAIATREPEVEHHSAKDTRDVSVDFDWNVPELSQNNPIPGHHVQDDPVSCFPEHDAHMRTQLLLGRA